MKFEVSYLYIYIYIYIYIYTYIAGVLNSLAATTNSLYLSIFYVNYQLIYSIVFIL